MFSPGWHLRVSITGNNPLETHPARATDPPRKLTLTIPGALLFRREIHEAYRVYLPARIYLYIRAQLYSGTLHAFPKTLSAGLARGGCIKRGRAFRSVDVRHIKYFRILRRAHFLRHCLAIFASARPRPGVELSRCNVARTDAVASCPERREKRPPAT